MSIEDDINSVKCDHNLWTCHDEEEDTESALMRIIEMMADRLSELEARVSELEKEKPEINEFGD